MGREKGSRGREGYGQAMERGRSRSQAKAGQEQGRNTAWAGYGQGTAGIRQGQALRQCRARDIRRKVHRLTRSALIN